MKKIKIALVGNPNSGKTTLFNALTGSNQFVGNWPGVTVEKKEGTLKNNSNVTITDLPGIYSLSPYTLEEVIARNYLLNNRPDVILNIVDGTRLNRNLYLSTQLTELDIPMVIAINMVDKIEKSGDYIDTQKLSEQLGIPIIPISALKENNLDNIINESIRIANSKKYPTHNITFLDSIEKTIDDIKNIIPTNINDSRRWYAIKILENDQKIIDTLNFGEENNNIIINKIKFIENKLDDDTESIISSSRYSYIDTLLNDCYKKSKESFNTNSDKIDRIVTNKWLGLPIFFMTIFIVYYLAMVSVGSAATDWANDGLFGDGFHLMGVGSKEYNADIEEYTNASNAVSAFININFEDDDALDKIKSLVPNQNIASIMIEDEETLAKNSAKVYYDKVPNSSDDSIIPISYLDAVNYFENKGFIKPQADQYGWWFDGIPTLMEKLLSAIGTADWLSSLIINGIVAGVGAVLGFVPQLMVLFLLLAFLESSGYMSRIAFILDRLFRRFSLSGQSFIPILIGTGCGIPGIMASRTIKSERDRKMTVITTTFIPCSAKVPFIAMIAGALFSGSAIVATSAYFIGMLAIILSGLILKKTKLFAGEPAPFIMELPPYQLPSLSHLLRSMWERSWSFIKKAGTIILLMTIIIWFMSFFGFIDSTFRMLSEDELQYSILASLGKMISWIFIPLGFGTWQATVASITGLIAKENIVGTMGILYGADGNTYENISLQFNAASGYAFLVFNLLCAPCFAAIGAIRREMNSAKWTWFAIGYQCGFAYISALIVYQLGSLYLNNASTGGVIIALLAIASVIYMIFKPYPVIKDKI